MKIAYFLNKENNNLDLIRILLACFVIVGHTIPLNGETPYWTDPLSFIFPVTYSGALAVKLFFFISGLVVTNSYLKNDSFIYFIISRVFRILPALLFVLLISVFVIGPIFTDITLSKYFSDTDNFKYITNNLIFRSRYNLSGVFNGNLYRAVVNGSLWSLHYEVWCYFFLMCSFALFKNKRVTIFNIIFIVILINSILPSRFILSYLSNNSEIYYLPFSFAYGAFLAINKNKLLINFKIVCCSFLIYFLFKNTSAVELFLIFAFCNLIVYLSSLKIILNWKPKHDISYGIYLWGFLVQQIIYALFGKIYAGLHFLIAIIASTLLAYISFVLIEKPFMLLGKEMLAFYNFKKENLLKR